MQNHKTYRINFIEKAVNLCLGYDFFFTWKVNETKTKINKWDYIKPKIFCTEKETINRVKRHPMEWEKILANHISDKVWISKIYKEFQKFNCIETNI